MSAHPAVLEALRMADRLTTRRYEVRVRGQLGETIRLAFADLRVETRGKDTVVLCACDQSAEDYAHQQPSLTKKKLRRLEITAGAPKNAPRAAGVWATNEMMREAELELARQADLSYKRMVTDQQAGAPAKKAGAGVTLERA